MKMKLGCGLFGLAFELEQDFWGTMKKLSSAGFTAVEPLYAFRGDPALKDGSQMPSFLKTILWDEERTIEYLPRLKELGLDISSMHVGFLFGKEIREGCEELAAFADRTGIRRFITSLEFDTVEKIEQAAQLMDTAAEILDGTGVTLGYHNHSMEFKLLDGDSGKTFMDHFLEITDPAVQLQLDVGWQMVGGSDVIAFIKRYCDRIVSVHLKDFVADYDKIPEEDSFAAIGYGALPTEEILRLLPELTLMENGLMIDQDRPSKGAILSEDLKKGTLWLADHLKQQEGDCHD